MSGDSLRGANLRGVDLREVNLRDADLRDVDLGEIMWNDLSMADLIGVYVDGYVSEHPNLGSADLRGANLSGADLTGAKGLPQEQINLASGNDNTNLPEGINPPAKWNQTSDQPNDDPGKVDAGDRATTARKQRGSVRVRVKDKRRADITNREGTDEEQD